MLAECSQKNNADESWVDAAEYICRGDRRCAFSTCELEKGKVVLQLGTANATLALQAATTVLQVRGNRWSLAPFLTARARTYRTL